VKGSFDLIILFLILHIFSNGIEINKFRAEVQFITSKLFLANRDITNLKNYFEK